MSCKVKQLGVEALSKKGAIKEESGVILDFSLFEKINNDLTRLALDKYKVGGTQPLFATKENDKGEVVIDPNEILFENLDEAIENYNIHADNIKKASNRAIREDLNSLESLKDESAEPLFRIEEKTKEEILQEKKSKNKIPEFKTQEEEVAYNIRRMLDNLSIAVARTRSNKNKTKLGKKYQEELEQLIADMEEIEDNQSWHAILMYVNKLEEVVNTVDKKVGEIDIDSDSVFEELKRYDDYLSTFDLVEEIKRLIVDAKISKNQAVNKEDIEKVNAKLGAFEYKYSQLKNSFHAIKKKKMVDLLADIDFQTEIETKWRNRFQAEYRKLKIKSIPKDTWVQKQLLAHKKEIEQDLRENANQIITGITADMSSVAANLYDSLNTNGKLFNVVVNIIADVRDNIIKRVRKFDFSLDELHKEIKDNLGSTKPSVAYKNVLHKTKAGKYFVRGDYKIQFYEEYQEKFIPLKTAFMEIRDGYLEDGYTIKEINKKPDFIKAKDAYYAWRNDNIINIGNNQFLPKDKWKDDHSDLNETELKILKKYHFVTKSMGAAMDGKASLRKKIFNVDFATLPSVTKSDLERFIELDAKGLMQDKIADLKGIRVDDTQYQREAATSKGKRMQNLKIHFRGDIDPSQQSLDLLTLMRLEVLNGVSYSERSKVEAKLNVIKDISANKQYAQESAKEGKFFFNLFKQKEPLETKDGIESNEYKRISGYIESSFYDDLHKHAPQMFGSDLNQITNVINGTTAFIGMSANIASGLANITNGFTQLFIESIGGNHLAFKSMVKAEAMYGKDLPNIIADWANPVKKSKTNQILEMFDVFGGFTVSNQDFIKDSAFKNLANLKTLSGLQEGGEHMMQAILTMSILDTQKVMDADGDYINKEGVKVKEKEEAASLLDMLQRNEKTKALEMSPLVVYTSQNMQTPYHKGGKAHINIFIKKKIHDTMGAYDSNHQNELYRVWYGKLLMMFKRFLIPGLQARWKGIGTAHIDREDMDESQLIYNTALKEYEEGTYTTLIRTVNAGKFFNHLFKGNIIPALEALKVSHMKENYEKMSDYERANLRKVTTELMITMIILPTMVAILLADLEEDEDDEKVWFMAYQLRRLVSELTQYRKIDEAWRITSNPIAGTRMLQNGIDVIGKLLNPFSWGEENSRGENKLVESLKDVTPIWVQLSKEWKQSYNFINNQAN